MMTAIKQNYCVFFDLVGTLIYADPPVVDTYFHFGRIHGSKLSRDEVEKRFTTLYRRTFHPDKISGGVTNDEFEKYCWRQVVYGIFDDTDNHRDLLFNNLWQHFSNPQNWSCYEDTHEVLRKLINMGIYTGIASNFDARIKNICGQLFPEITPDRIFFSSEIEYAKPHPAFYKSIEKSVNITDAIFVIVGDDPVNDIQAARNAGWISIHRNALEKLESIYRFDR